METSRQTHSSGYFWLTWWGDTGTKWLKVVIPQTSGVQVQVQCDHFSPESLYVAGKCWWIFGEIITVCAAQKCINIPEMSVFWTIGSPQVRILTVTNLMPPSHFHIWREQEKQKLPQIVFTLILTSSTLLRCWLTCASCDLAANERTVLRLLTNENPGKGPRS